MKNWLKQNNLATFFCNEIKLHVLIFPLKEEAIKKFFVKTNGNDLISRHNEL